MWKALSAAERMPFDDRADEDKMRYLQEVSVYNLAAETKIVPRINAPPGFFCPETVSAGRPRALTAYSIFTKQVLH